MAEHSSHDLLGDFDAPSLPAHADAKHVPAHTNGHADGAAVLQPISPTHHDAHKSGQSLGDHSLLLEQLDGNHSHQQQSPDFGAHLDDIKASITTAAGVVLANDVPHSPDGPKNPSPPASPVHTALTPQPPSPVAPISIASDLPSPVSPVHPTPVSPVPQPSPAPQPSPGAQPSPAGPLSPTAISDVTPHKDPSPRPKSPFDVDAQPFVNPLARPQSPAIPDYDKQRQKVEYKGEFEGGLLLLDGIAIN
jgi:hypothetical protein